MNIEKLKKAHYAAAKIVEKLGDEYLNFFERIHIELMEENKRHALKNLAASVANSKENPN